MIEALKWSPTSAPYKSKQLTQIEYFRSVSCRCCCRCQMYRNMLYRNKVGTETRPGNQIVYEGLMGLMFLMCLPVTLVVMSELLLVRCKLA